MSPELRQECIEVIETLINLIDDLDTTASGSWDVELDRAERTVMELKNQ